MNQEIMIGIVIVAVLLLIAGGFIMKKKMDEKNTMDKFDISVDPLAPVQYEWKSQRACDARPKMLKNPTQYNGLNPEYDSHVSVKDYIDTYEKAQNWESPLAASTVAKRYCDILYGNHGEYFHDRWMAEGDCEIQVKKEVEELVPGTPRVPLFDQ